MPDLLQNLLAVQAGILLGPAAPLITVSRGGQSISIKAAYGQTPYQVTDQSGLMTVVLSHDFIVKAADYTFGEPQRGDLITKTVNGAATTFEVLAPHNQPVFQSDAYDTTYRIHTKQVTT